MASIIEPSILEIELSNSSAATTSSTVNETTFGLLPTKDMIRDEKHIEATMLSREEAKERREKIQKEIQEECFKKLMDLLSISNVYTANLVGTMKKREEDDNENILRRSDRLNVASLQTDVRNGTSLPKSVSSPLTKQNDSSMAGKRKRSFSKENEEKDAKKMKVIPTLSQRQEVQLTHPSLFTGGVMRDYQLEGVEWLKLLYKNGLNGILADEMGLGKTIQTIALIAHLIERGYIGPFMIVAPLSTLPNWKSEFNRFAPKIPVIMYHGDADKRQCLRKKFLAKVRVRGKLVYPVTLIAYHTVIHDQRKLVATCNQTNRRWRYLIIDEGHRIKNFKCILISVLKRLDSGHRLLLTGTPLQNNLSELWSLLNFLLPEIFNDLQIFQAWFDTSQMAKKKAEEEIVRQEQEKKILSTLHQILTPFLLRRTKADVELNLPPKKEILVYAPLAAKQKKLYKESIDRKIASLGGKEEEEKPELNENGRPKRKISTKKDYKELDENTPLNDSSRDIILWKDDTIMKKSIKKLHLNHSLINIMIQLRKVCNHPYLVEQPVSPSGDYLYQADMVALSGKLSLLDSMLIGLKNRGHKVLLFSQMVRMLDIIEEYCIRRKFRYSRLDGTMELSEREVMVQDFNHNPNTFIFLISTRAGGLGLNLTAADTVIVYDSDWNPQVDLQAQDRCHRMGQTKPVMVYRLVTADTVDHVMVERATAKRRLEKIIMKQGRFVGKAEKVTQFTPEELLSILKSKDHLEVHSTQRQYKLTPRQLELLLDRSNITNGGDIEGLFKVVSNTCDDKIIF